MISTDNTNSLFNLAAELVNNTSRHVFLTGKAGTGKTTFLKYIKETTRKNAVVVAPTGVAAINAGGVTMHSFFQLPFGPFIPSASRKTSGGIEITDRHNLFSNIRFNSDKRQLLQELELLIIDEVSMVRCDMLDALDLILRHFRRQPLLPFGGVQVVYIGDMFQLPPVVPSHEWEILKEHYESPFFFNAKAIKESPPIYVELKKIYRQNEQHFIDILNNVRNNVVTADDMMELNKRYDPEFVPPPEKDFITLTTHNRKADIINEKELNKIKEPLFSFKADVSGEFSEKAFPTDVVLNLKKGAQVMFIKNDTGTDRRYFNGKLAVIRSISKDEIIVGFNDDDKELKLEIETWKNIRYNYDKQKDDIEEEELGSFKQYPIRLAWAITIHKSQGLTFDHAVIDAGASFAAGQVYVALSRCTSLKGLVLHSKINRSSIATDGRIIEFAKKEANDDLLEELLEVEKKKYQSSVLVKTFSMSKLLRAMEEWTEMIADRKLPDEKEVWALNKRLTERSVELSAIAEKFQQQLQVLLQQNNTEVLHERINKAILYFGKAIVDDIIIPLYEHVDSLQHASRVRTYLKQMKEIETEISNQLKKLNAIQYNDLVFVTYVDYRIKKKPFPAKKAQTQKGSSKQDTLALFKEGRSVPEIAALRNLAQSTIEGHLTGFVLTGDIPVTDLVPSKKVEAIMELVLVENNSATYIKTKLGDDYSYGEIRAVTNHYRFLRDKKAETAQASQLNG